MPVEYYGELNPALWDGDRLRPDVREHLLATATRFVESSDAQVAVTDAVLTGSNANYNWTAHSDLDVHVIYDPKNVDEHGLLGDYLLDHKRLFNAEHQIRVKGFPVEVYPQTATEPFYGGGVYSLANDEWVIRPSHVIPDVDDCAVAAKVKDFTARIEAAIEGDGDVPALRDAVHRLRLAGLESGGEFSVENVAFKELRAQGLLDRLAAAGREREDRVLSLDRRRRSVHVHLYGGS